MPSHLQHTGKWCWRLRFWAWSRCCRPASTTFTRCHIEQSPHLVSSIRGVTRCWLVLCRLAVQAEHVGLQRAYICGHVTKSHDCCAGGLDNAAVHDGQGSQVSHSGAGALLQRARGSAAHHTDPRRESTPRGCCLHCRGDKPPFVCRECLSRHLILKKNRQNERSAMMGLSGRDEPTTLRGIARGNPSSTLQRKVPAIC